MYLSLEVRAQRIRIHSTPNVKTFCWSHKENPKCDLYPASQSTHNNMVQFAIA